MKIHKIINLDTKQIYYVKNKQHFCDEMNLTRRLLDYTKTGQRNHHKRFVLSPDYIEFRVSPEGDTTLFEGEKGFVMDTIEETIEDESLIKKIVQLEKSVQNYKDKLRIANKQIREHNREKYIEEDFLNTVESLIEHKEFDLPKIKISKDKNKPKMIVQLSDIHFGKVVKLQHNTYNINVAKKRLGIYLNSIIKNIYRYNVNEVYVAMTGDFFQLDHRMDSLLTNEDNRANVFIQGYDIMFEFLQALSNICSIKVIGVLGNESRIVTSEWNSNIDSIASNNFDTLLFRMLKRTCKNIEFIGDCDSINEILYINNKRIALTHGDKLKHKNDDIFKYKIKLSEAFKSYVDYIIFGHIHSTVITSGYARSGSLVGSDEYAFNGLNIPENYPSQNIYIVEDNGNILALEIKVIEIK